MPILNMEEFLAKAQKDSEFVRETRYLNGAVKLAIADQTYVLHFEAGKLTRIGGDDTKDGDCKIVIKGTRDHWVNLLADKPRPFYQCLQSTAVRHGLAISDTNETFAYLPALNRMTTLMRQTYNQGSRA
jgi:hypothetical protein